MKRRTADPYADVDVIDARAPRFNQAVIGALALVAALTGFWALYAVLAAQLAAGLVFGRRFCLPCLAYFELVQPRLGEGPIEDARPNRFANVVGFAVLSLAALTGAAGLGATALVLGLLVATLALVAAATGFCTGCELYRLGARVRGIRRTSLGRIDLAEIGVEPGSEVVVQFTHPLCTECRNVKSRLGRQGRTVVTVDVSKRPELARKYGVAIVPTALAVGPDGTVSARLQG